MSISNFFFLTFIFLISSPPFLISSSGTSFNTVVFNVTRMSQLINNFMSLDTTEPPLLITDSPFSFPIYHKELIIKSTFKDYKSLVEARLNNDKARIMQTILRLEPQNFSSYGSDPYSAIVSDINGAYVVALEVGTPGVRQQLILDTGSSLSWWNCNPCQGCLEPEPEFPRYDPERSSSHDALDCKDPLCDRNLRFIRRCIDERYCSYKIEYPDRTESTGEMGYERLTTTGKAKIIDRMPFGCSYSTYIFKGTTRVTGLLGANRGTHSIITQSDAKNFTMCLPPHYKETSSFFILHFLPPDDNESYVIPAPILDNPSRSFFYVGLNGISIGGEMLPILDDVWKIEDNGNGGVIVDLGTIYTWLRPSAYLLFAQTYIQKAREVGVELQQDPERAGGPDICGTIQSGLRSVKIPSLELHFSNTEKSYKLGPEQIMMSVENQAGRYCLAFGKMDGVPITILGTYQLQTTRLAFALAGKTLYLTPQNCG